MLSLSLWLDLKTDKYIPWLAESFEWVDGTHFRVVIRDDVYFHNDEKMTPEDVIYSCNLGRTSPSSAGGWKMVEDIVKVDETTVEFILNQADVDFMEALSGPSGSITCAKYYEEVGSQEFGLHPIGTGYFMWDSYTSGDNVTMKAFDKYWGEHGTIKTYIVRFISETSQALIELENGNVDIITADGSTITSVANNENIKLIRYNNGLNEYCGFNFNSTKVQDIKVRQALAYAIDREAIVAGAREGVGTASYSVVPKSQVYSYNEETETYYNHAPEKATELLKELGYSKDNPLELTLLTDTSTVRTLEAQQIKNMADAVGFKINIATFESATVTSILAGGEAKDYDLFIRALGGLETSATMQMSTIFSVGATEVGNNPFWFTLDTDERMEEYNNLFLKAKSSTEDQERYTALKELAVLEREMLLANWLVYQETVYAVNAKLTGFRTYGASVRFECCYFVE